MFQKLTGKIQGDVADSLGACSSTTGIVCGIPGPDCPVDEMCCFKLCHQGGERVRVCAAWDKFATPAERTSKFTKEINLPCFRIKMPQKTPYSLKKSPGVPAKTAMRPI